ncbi:MAG: hypothetical protein PVJ26_11470, partial [Anaerolineae bacterium]|jgi:hypothetical protein
VYRYGSDRRIEHASLKATKDDQVRYTTTDDDGDFDLKELEPGTWTLVALHDRSFPSKAQQVELVDKDKTGLRIDLFRLQGNEDQKMGRNLFIGLLVALGLLIALYVSLHLAFPRQPAPLSPTLARLIDRAQLDLVGFQQPSDDPGLLATIDSIRADVELALEQNADVSAYTGALLTNLLDEIEGSVQANDKEDLLARLAILEQLVASPSEPEVAPWDQDPWRYLEVLFWALAGILVNKVIIVGWYLRNQRFYREGLMMHIAHLVSTPLLVLVAVLLLSLATLNITLSGGNQLAIDLSEPNIMIAVSFLLGTIPWPLWNFIEDTAERFAGRMG